jgi:phosphoribosylaminoimidazole-succinocarboxamide synthase
VALLETVLPGRTARRGKVRDLYDLGDRLLLVATDRISAFDWVLPTGIPDKGRVLTGLSAFWFEWLNVSNHLITPDIDEAGLDASPETLDALRGRSMVVKKADVIPFECVVRGYLSGSAWKEYRATGTVCGERLPAGLVESAELDRPYFTPATKAETGHDENVPFSRLADAVGIELAATLQDRSIAVYEKAKHHAEARGLILADTKFEWGFEHGSGQLLLIDEVLTPDSSRYWSRQTFRPGGPQPSYDKQFVRDWLEASGWDKASPPPALPADIVAKTREKYVDAYEILTGRHFPWK